MRLPKNGEIMQMCYKRDIGRKQINLLNQTMINKRQSSWTTRKLELLKHKIQVD